MASTSWISAVARGYFARSLHERGARRITGIDISAEMIALATATERREQRGIRYRVGDAGELDALEDDSLDLVVAVFLFNYLDRAQAAKVTAAVNRVLKPGGRFVFAGPHPLLPYLKEQAPPFYFCRGSHGYFSGRDQSFEGFIWKRDGGRVAVRCVHKTIDDYFACLRDGGFTSMPDVKELHATEEHHAFDPSFFEPLREIPLHIAFRVEKCG